MLIIGAAGALSVRATGGAIDLAAREVDNIATEGLSARVVIGCEETDVVFADARAGDKSSVSGVRKTAADCVFLVKSACASAGCVSENGAV